MCVSSWLLILGKESRTWSQTISTYTIYHLLIDLGATERFYLWISSLYQILYMWLSHFEDKDMKLWRLKSEVAQSCLTLCGPMDCSLWGSSVHGIFQERALEWVAISFSRGSSWPRSPAWQADALPSEPPGKPNEDLTSNQNHTP